MALNRKKWAAVVSIALVGIGLTYRWLQVATDPRIATSFDEPILRLFGSSDRGFDRFNESALAETAFDTLHSVPPNTEPFGYWAFTQQLVPELAHLIRNGDALSDLRVMDALRNRPLGVPGQEPNEQITRGFYFAVISLNSASFQSLRSRMSTRELAEAAFQAIEERTISTVQYSSYEPNDAKFRRHLVEYVGKSYDANADWRGLLGCRYISHRDQGEAYRNALQKAAGAVVAIQSGRDKEISYLANRDTAEYWCNSYKAK